MFSFVRSPAFRRPLDLFLIILCSALAVYVLVPEVFGPGKTKDYPLWYEVGQKIFAGAPLYEIFDYLYPPFPALLIAPLTLLGKAPFYLLLIAINSAALWLAVSLSQTMVAGRRMPGPWIEVLPPLILLPQIVETFDLGQPNLLLLVAMLAGFRLLERGRPILAGSLFAFAAAVKVFPISVLPYLLWRRHWRASASLVAFLAIFLVLAPAPFRGLERNANELSQWFDGMTGSAAGFGHREAQNWSWKNQSIIALTHRITRLLNYYQEDPNKPPAYMNLFALDYRAANWVVLGVFTAFGLGFIALMVPIARLTKQSHADEIAILLCLMTIASPLARTYYFVWLLFPIFVLAQRAFDDPRPRVQRWTYASLAFVFGLNVLAFGDIFQAFGTNTAAALLVAGMLAWHMRHPVAPASGLPRHDPPMERPAG